MPQSGVQTLVDRSGQLTVFCDATEIGQGSDDVLVAIGSTFERTGNAFSSPSPARGWR